MTEKPRARILVAEDSSVEAHLIQFALEHAGFCVTLAVDGMDALQKAQYDRFDLVVTDDLMPRMTGRELCLRLRDDPRHADTPIIFVTAKKIEIESEIIDSFGSETAVIGKPFSTRAFLRTVETTLGLASVLMHLRDLKAQPLRLCWFLA